MLYILFGFYLFFSQKSILYHPDNQDFKRCSGFKDYQKLEANGTRFYFKEGQGDDVIVYYHGNAGSACDRSYARAVFEQSDASLIFVEYAGYSNDDVNPSEELILNDVENIHNYIYEKDYEEVTVYGQSIGSGAASYHAGLGDVENLILVSPFSSLEKVAQSKYVIYPASILLTKEYDNVKWLKDYHGRLLIIHGDSDSIIPEKFSKELYQSIPSLEKEYILIEERGHNDIWLSANFKRQIIQFIKSDQE